MLLSVALVARVGYISAPADVDVNAKVLLSLPLAVDFVLWPAATKGLSCSNTLVAVSCPSCQATTVRLYYKNPVRLCYQQTSMVIGSACSNNRAVTQYHTACI